MMTASCVGHVLDVFVTVLLYVILIVIELLYECVDLTIRTIITNIMIMSDAVLPHFNYILLLAWL